MVSYLIWDQKIIGSNPIVLINGECSSIGRVPVCETGVCGIETRRSPVSF
jgi:hypothetical protein